MRARVKEVDWNDVPTRIAGYAKKEQTFLTTSSQYEVYALSVFRCMSFLLLVDDRGRPYWSIDWLVDLIDHEIPADWICTIFQSEPTLLLGPKFIASNQ